MNIARVNITGALGGKGSRDTHAVNFLVRGTGLTATRAEKVAVMIKLAESVCGVCFADYHVMRASYVEIDRFNRVIPNTCVSEPLNLVGRTAVPTGGAPAGETIVAIIEKQADIEDAGQNKIRHCLSSDELNAYQEAGTIPTRFTDAPAGGFGSGEAIVDNLKTACSTSGHALVLPSRWEAGVEIPRPVTICRFVGFDVRSATQTRIDATTKILQGIQQKLNAWARKVRKVLRDIANGNTAAALVTLILDIRNAALALWTAQATAEKALLKFPQVLALPV